MASDRQRRGRQPNADSGGDDARDDLERSFGEGEPVDPLGQSMPDVTEAQMAETGAVQRAGLQGKSPIEEVEREPSHGPRKGIFGRAADFLRASWTELRRVQWPDRRHVGQGPAVTIGFVVVAGAYLGLLDAIWNPIIQKIL